MKSSLRDKLKAYSLTAGAVAAGAAGHAQILYTNENPDVTVTGLNNSYNLDLNNDNITDFILNINQTTNTGSFTFSSGFFLYSSVNRGVKVEPQGSNAIFGNWPIALSAGEDVEQQSYGWYSYGSPPLAANANVFSSYSFSTYYGGSYAGTFTFSSLAGNFNGAQDKYLGLRLELSGNTHYGWVRLDVPNDTTFTVKDYALELAINTPIETGDTGLAFIASPAMNVVANDVADAGNSADVIVDFDAAANEATVLLYRAIFVKETSVPSFDITAAQALGTTSALPILPNGSTTYAEPLLGGMKDSDGDLVSVGVPYQLFIHSIANPNTTINDNLSSPSDTVVLESVPGFGPVQAVNIVDVANNANGLDLEVNFNKLVSEAALDAYRIFIVKAGNSSAFSLVDAQSNINFLPVTPNGQNISTVLNSFSSDTDGDVITDGVPYRAFVMSVADGVNATSDFLSPASNELTLDDAVGINDPKTREALLLAYDSEGVRIAGKSGQALEAYEVYSLDGKQVQASSGQLQEIRLTRQDLASGMYMVKINESNTEHLIKVMIR